MGFLGVTLSRVIALWRFGRQIESRPEAPLVVAALAFGTPFLFYARTFFARAATAAWLFLAWDRLRASEESASAHSLDRAAALAGLLSGVVPMLSVALPALAVAVAFGLALFAPMLLLAPAPSDGGSSWRAAALQACSGLDLEGRELERLRLAR